MSFAPLQSIGTDGAPTVGLEILKSHLAGEMSFSDALTAWAVAASDQCSDWKPAIYPPCPTAVTAYANGRLHGSRPHDRATGRMLGEWVYSARLTKESNDAQIGSMLWAVEKCETQGLTENVKALKNSIDRFHSVRFPYQELRTCEACQKLDSSSSQAADMTEGKRR